MKIRKLTIKNFRGLSDVFFTFDRPTNVIVGPNAIGKTTILEAIRLVKALLMPRYYEETQQVLVALGAVSPHAPLLNYVDAAALARDNNIPVEVSLQVEFAEKEIESLQVSVDDLAIEQVRGRLGRTDQLGQFALTQFLSSPDGKQMVKGFSEDVEKRLKELATSRQFTVQLTLDPKAARLSGSDAFLQSLVSTLERRQPPTKTLLSYFPADRAFPIGEVNVQISSAEANAQMQSHLGQAPTKYQRLKQTVVNNILLSGMNQDTISADFQLVFNHLLPGKELAGVSLTPVGNLKVAIREASSGKIFDIDSMSSGEKGLILTFLLIRRSVGDGGIVLVDEPELHLNPAVCKKIIPFLNEHIIPSHDLQVIICTHSAEILGSSFERADCGVYHLRSHKDATRIYERDNREVFEAFRRLGTTAADTLFSRGNLFVEGDHDSAVLDEGFFESLAGYRITGLGGRGDVEKEIRTLQDAEKRGELDKIQCFIFDLDRRPSDLKSTLWVRVLQWDRYCLENYLLGSKTLYDTLQEVGAKGLGSRGEFEQTLRKLALAQLKQFVAKTVYGKLEPQNPGIRPQELRTQDFGEMADALAARLTTIKEQLSSFDPSTWRADFIGKCKQSEQDRNEAWGNDWVKLSDGKRMFDELYQELQIPLAKLELKKRVAKRMAVDQSEDWTLVRSKLRDAFGE